MMINKASFGTAHRDVNVNNEDTSTWAELLNKEGGQDKNDGIQPKTGPTETAAMSKGKSQVDSVVLSYIYTELMVAKRVACAM